INDVLSEVVIIRYRMSINPTTGRSHDDVVSLIVLRPIGCGCSCPIPRHIGTIERLLVPEADGDGRGERMDSPKENAFNCERVGCVVIEKSKYESIRDQWAHLI